MGNKAHRNRKIIMATENKLTSLKTNSSLVQTNKKVYLPCLWPYRLIGNIILLSLLTLFCFGIVIIRSNLVEQKLISLSDYFYKITSSLGFTVDDILVYGRNKTAIEEISNIVNTRRGDNILSLNIRQIKNDIEQLPWVKSATVSRSYLPNILKIRIKERHIQSLWQINNVFYPIDTEGAVIHAEYVPNHPTLLLVGKGAPQNMKNLLKIIDSDKEIYSRIKVATYISERRWNLILDDIENGITVKLPAQDTEEAWQKLLKLNKTQGLLKRKLTIIDLRFKDKVLVRPRKGTNGESLKLDTGNESNI